VRRALQVRKAAERAKEKLLVGARIDGDTPVVAAGENAVAKHVRAALASLPATVCHYAAEVTAELLEDREVTTATVRARALLLLLCTAAHCRLPALLCSALVAGVGERACAHAEQLHLRERRR
jgi:hypothetical protein